MPLAETDKLMVSINEAARLMSVSRATINRMRADGTPRSKRVGRHVRIPFSELKRLAENDDAVIPISSDRPADADPAGREPAENNASTGDAGQRSSVRAGSE